VSRLGAAAATLLAALLLAGVAQATLAPAPGALKPLKLVLAQRSEHAIVSCSVHGTGMHGQVSRLEKKLGPVACEHPPRSQPLDGNFVLAP
jgi:hypothetical protein